VRRQLLATQSTSMRICLHSAACLLSAREHQSPRDLRIGNLQKLCLRLRIGTTGAIWTLSLSGSLPVICSHKDILHKCLKRSRCAVLRRMRLLRSEDSCVNGLEHLDIHRSFLRRKTHLYQRLLHLVSATIRSARAITALCLDEAFLPSRTTSFTRCMLSRDWLPHHSLVALAV